MYPDKEPLANNFNNQPFIKELDATNYIYLLLRNSFDTFVSKQIIKVLII